MSEDRSVERKLTNLSRFGLRGGRGGRAAPNIPTPNKPNVAATPKRTFSPNIVSRAIKKEDVQDVQHPQSKERRSRRDRSHRGRGRGRGREGNIIQADGVFSHGIFAQPTLAKALSGGYGNYGGGSGGGSGGGESSTPQIKAEKVEEDINIESDKVFEMMEDEGKIEMNDRKDGSLMPITLPLATKLTQKIRRAEIKIEDESQDEKENVKASDAMPPPVEIADLFKSDSAEGQLFFLQLPDTLPIKPISEDQPVKQEGGGGAPNEKSDKNKDNVKEQDLADHLKRFTFQNVSEGLIGKLRIHKSGKAKMHLGNVTLDLTLGTPCGFLQDLVSVQTDSEPAEMVSLGHVKHRLIAIPDYKALLGSVTI